MCFNCCGIKVHRINGVAVLIEGNPDCPSTPGGKLCAKGHAGLEEIYSPTRVKVPLKRTNPEKGIGVDPKWVEISWEEAFDTITQKLKRIREEDPRKLLIVSFDIDFFLTMRAAFGLAFGTPNLWTGGARYWCGNGLHPIAYLTHGTFSFDPNVEHCDYLLMIGSQSGFGLDANPIVRAKGLADARARGMKVVVADPVMSTAGAKADEWIPIRPGTDAAFALTVINTLINELGIYDAEFLKKHTNAPYFIGPDGHYLRDKAMNKPLIWDAVEEKAKTYDDPSIKDFASEGSYKVNGTDSKTAFQLLKEHVKKYTPEEVSQITTIPAATIRRIAQEFGKAARIGSTIMIGGKMLPHRPACAHYCKGPSGHKHSILTGFSIQLMNMIVGAMDTPGGHLGSNPVMLPNDVCSMSWAPTEGPDGILSMGQPGPIPSGFPARPVKQPQSLDLWELFPASQYSEPMSQVVFSDLEKYNVPGYTPEAIIHCHSNLIMSVSNSKAVAEWLKKVPFQLSFAREIDEMAEFADIILPNTTYLEQLDALPDHPIEYQESGLGVWYYTLRQPVVAPPPNVRNWQAVLFEDIAERVGFRRELYQWLNTIHKLEEPYNLDLDKKYSWEELTDILIKSKFGPEHDLAWFKEHGFIKWPKKVEETYPRPFLKPRIPIYLEHYLELGKEVKKMADEVGYTWWDVSDYQPLAEWKPCLAYEHKSPEYDLYAVNFRLPYHTFTHTGYNTWLEEVTEYASAYDILINSQTAKKKGIQDGDIVWLQPEDGKEIKGEGIKGRVRITEGIHPEVVGIGGHFGHWAARLTSGKGKGVHFNTLYMADLERMDMVGGALDACVKVKISKAT